ncbi:MAG: glycosyltransferase [Anaerolineales bacterium]|nr:glycosyltransferase [Anaerolineales bacterium]
MSPTVSVIIPVYNQAHFVGQAIDSILAQTFTDYEIIVVNDGSTDHTTQVLAGYGDRLHIITQANAGLSAARNSGLQVARGEMIGLLDADDLWYPEMLAATVTFLKENPHIDLVYGAWDTIDETGRVIKPLNKPSNLRTKVQADFLRSIATGNLFLVHTLLIRRKCFDCCGVFDPNLRAVEDWDLWVRMAAHGHTVDVIDTPIAHYRRHSGNMTYDPQRMEQASRRLLTRLFSNDLLAQRVADLEEHAYIDTWLTIAGFCHAAGMETETRRYVQLAKELFVKAPHNPELNIRHYDRLLKLPEAEDFMKIIVGSTPEILLKYFWRKGQQVLWRGDFRLILARLKWRNLVALGTGLKEAFIKRIEE